MWDGVDGRRAGVRVGRGGARGRPLRRGPALRRGHHRPRAARAPPRASTTSSTSPRRRRSRTRRWPPTSRRWWTPSSSRTCASCSSGCSTRSTEVGERWHEAPAAKYYHQAYRHGLLEHCLSVAQGVSALAATFPAIDRDVAVTGALLHDIGKVEAYAWTGQAIELTDAGKLLGEIPLGYFRVRTEMDGIDGFPPRHRAGRAPHHPQPPRQARARQPGGARARARPRSCTSSTTSVATSAASTGSRRAWPTEPAGRHFDRGISASAYFGPSEAEGRREAA